jgi:hypothetical protein
VVIFVMLFVVFVFRVFRETAHCAVLQPRSGGDGSAFRGSLPSRIAAL